MDNIPMRRMNQIIDAVNRRYPKEAIGVKPGDEERYYNGFWAEAQAHVDKYGFWPTFEMGEIESEDPVLGIYGD